MPEDWPSEDQVQELLDATSGFFVFASTCLSFIDDPDEADPRSQLDSLLSFMRRSQGVVSRNPLAALDLLYSRILANIPHAVFETTSRILAYMPYHSNFYRKLGSPQVLCNFLRLDQHAFYKAARGLHSVMNIPEPDDAAESQLQFHHTSFQDFLLNPMRSGKFVVDKHKMLMNILPFVVYWYDIDLTHFHTHDGWSFDTQHQYGNLPGLTWAPEDNRRLLSQSILGFLEWGIFDPSYNAQLDGVDEDILFHLSNIDFRYWYPWNIFGLVILCRLDPSGSLVRLQPSSPTDEQLLKHFTIVTSNRIAKPATFPVTTRSPGDQRIQEYFFIGHGVKSVIAWKVFSPTSNGASIYSLRSDEEPTEAQVSKYDKDLEVMEWDEAKARAENEISTVRC